MREREFFGMRVKKLMALVSAICSSGEEMLPIFQGWAAIQVSVFFCISNVIQLDYINRYLLGIY